VKRSHRTRLLPVPAPPSTRRGAAGCATAL
jgi:hypothetical protein